MYKMNSHNRIWQLLDSYKKKQFFFFSFFNLTLKTDGHSAHYISLRSYGLSEYQLVLLYPPYLCSFRLRQIIHTSFDSTNSRLEGSIKLFCGL